MLTLARPSLAHPQRAIFTFWRILPLVSSLLRPRKSKKLRKKFAIRPNLNLSRKRRLRILDWRPIFMRKRSRKLIKALRNHGQSRKLWLCSRRSKCTGMTGIKVDIQQFLAFLEILTGLWTSELNFEIFYKFLSCRTRGKSHSRWVYHEFPTASDRGPLSGRKTAGWYGRKLWLYAFTFQVFYKWTIKFSYWDQKTGFQIIFSWKN